jgi:lysozyme
VTPEERKALAAQLIAHEGERLTVYRCPAGKLSIGVGRNLEDRGLSIDESRMLLSNDISDCWASLSSALPWFATLDPIRQRVLLDLRFNVGMGGFMKFRKMLSACAVADYNTAAAELQNSAWFTQVQPSRSAKLVRMLRTGVE